MICWPVRWLDDRTLGRLLGQPDGRMVCWTVGQSDRCSAVWTVRRLASCGRSVSWSVALVTRFPRYTYIFIYIYMYICIYIFKGFAPCRRPLRQQATGDRLTTEMITFSPETVILETLRLLFEYLGHHFGDTGVQWDTQWTHCGPDVRFYRF